MAGPGTALRTIGFLLLVLALALIGAAAALPWGATDGSTARDDRFYWVWGLESALPHGSPQDKGPYVWVERDLDDAVEGLGLFRMGLVMFALGAAGTVVALLMTIGAYKQRRRGYRWAGLAGFASAGLLLAGVVLYLAGMFNHLGEAGLKLHADKEIFTHSAGLYLGVGALLVVVVAAILLALGGRGVSPETQALEDTAPA